MSRTAKEMLDQAISWHLRLDHAGAEEWRAFIAWLEADPAHRDAYDRLVMDDALLTPRLELPEMPPAGSSRHRFRRWPVAGGAVAAALLAALLLPHEERAADLYTVETPPGTSRTVTLDEGTSILMNGGTRLTLRRGDSRYAQLENGEATFRIRHDADRPFELTSGPHRLRDVGTLFNVVREPKQLSVEVAEGAVLYEPDRRALTLRPGMALAIDDAGARARLARVPVETVGSWRRGVASFQMASIDSVARSVSRATGAKLGVAPGLSDRRFTGTIHLDGEPSAVVARTAALADVGLRRQTGGWILMPRSDADR